MNSNRSEFDRPNQNNSYQTNRSERYRFPEQESNYRFDDYGSSAHGGYGNEGYSGTWGNQGNEGAGSRNVANHDLHGSTYSTSRNQGNMGSYGGAQGFGSDRGGYSSQRAYTSGSSGHDFDSGMGHPREAGRSGYGSDQHRAYGYQSDSDSHGSDMGYNANPDLYGSDTDRRFQGAQAQHRYSFKENDYSRDPYKSRNQSQYGYSNQSRGDYGSRDGNFGSFNSQNNPSSNQRFGGSGFSGSGYSDHDASYIQSRNRERTFRNNRENNYDQY